MTNWTFSLLIFAGLVVIRSEFPMFGTLAIVAFVLFWLPLMAMDIEEEP